MLKKLELEGVTGFELQMRKARHKAKFNGQNNWGLTYKEEMNYILITYSFHLEGTKKNCIMISKERINKKFI